VEVSVNVAVRPECRNVKFAVGAVFATGGV
jgi:hypothetical protein